jgi:hypothetical protein
LSRRFRAKHAALRSVFTERSRRLWAATEARALGYGGIAAVARATGLSPAMISRGLAELDADAPLPVDRVRKPGAGRKGATTHHPTLLRDLDALVEPTAPGRRHDFVIPGARAEAIPYGVYDLHRNEGLGQRGRRPRHGDRRGAVDSALVAAHGPGGVSRRHVAAHHRGRRGKQWRSAPAVEVGAAAQALINLRDSG